MTKSNSKGASYVVMALFVLTTISPVLIQQYPTVKWLVTVSACATCLWRAKDYFVNGEDVCDPTNPAPIGAKKA